MLSMTVNDLLDASLRAIHIISPSESISAGQAKTARQALNIMISLWSAKGLVVPVMTRESFTLTAFTYAYTMGTGGDLDSVRPLAVMDTSYVSNGDSDYPLRVIGDGEYGAIADKTITGLPAKICYRATFPLAYLYFYPAPDDAYECTLLSQKLFTDYTALTTTISLSPEYYAAIKWNLAIELCPDYEKEPSPTVVVLAERSLDAIMALNAANRLEPIKQNLGLEGGMRGCSWCDNLCY